MSRTETRSGTHWTADSIDAADRRAVLHPFTQVGEYARSGGVLMREASGVWLRDVRGREYLDANAGLWCVNAGYGRAEIVDAMAEQARRLPFYHSFAGLGNDTSVRLADRLVSRFTGTRRVFFGLSGSDANETQLKLARFYHRAKGRPRRTKVLAHRRGYHGVTFGAGSATGLSAAHEPFGLPLPGFVHLRTPHRAREAPELSDAEFTRALAGELEETLAREDPETVAAFIAEPVIGAGGVLAPPDGYFAAIQPILRRHDILFIADEVICGFGRLGCWLGGERYRIAPDLVTLAKGLTSGYAPLSACLVGERVAEVLESPSAPAFNHGYTYSGHPVSAAAALANLDVLERERLIERAEASGALLQKLLRERLAGHPLVGDVRGVAMMAAVELAASSRSGLRPPAVLSGDCVARQVSAQRGKPSGAQRGEAERRSDGRDERRPADPTRGGSFDPAQRVGRRMFELLLEERVICRQMIGDAFGFSPALIATSDEIEEMAARFSRALDRLGAERAA